MGTLTGMGAMTTTRFNPAPGWPAPPKGWTPPPGWAPDPTWPAAPQGWQLYVDEAAAPAPSARSKLRPSRLLGEQPAGTIGNQLTYFDGSVLVHQPPFKEATIIPVGSINGVVWRRPGRLLETHLRVIVSGAGEPVTVSPPLYRGLGGRMSALCTSFGELADALKAAIAARTAG